MGDYNSTWSDAAARYQSTVGVISAKSAIELVDMVSSLQALTSESHVLDAVGFPSAPIIATDTSQVMFTDLKTNLAEAGIDESTVKLLKSDVNSLTRGFKQDAFSHVFASYVLHIASTDFGGVVKQIHNILQPSGVFGIATFSPHTEAYIVWDRVCRIFDPEYTQAPMSVDPRAWCTPGQMAAGLQKLGFKDIKTVLRRERLPFTTAEEWSGFWFGGKNPAAELVIKPFFDSHDVPLEDVKTVYERIMKDEWESKVLAEYVLAVARK